MEGAAGNGNSDEGGLHHIQYYETEHYKIVSDFLVNPERMLKILLE